MSLPQSDRGPAPSSAGRERVTQPLGYTDAPSNTRGQRDPMAHGVLSGSTFAVNGGARNAPMPQLPGVAFATVGSGTTRVTIAPKGKR
jgi:hypothetical protein